MQLTSPPPDQPKRLDSALCRDELVGLDKLKLAVCGMATQIVTSAPLNGVNIVVRR